MENSDYEETIKKELYDIERNYTTGDVARICKVSMTTARKWFNVGIIKGFRVPESRYVRIPNKNLINFMEEHKIPLNFLRDYIS